MLPVAGTPPAFPRWRLWDHPHTPASGVLPGRCCTSTFAPVLVTRFVVCMLCNCKFMVQHYDDIVALSVRMLYDAAPLAIHPNYTLEFLSEILRF